MGTTQPIRDKDELKNFIAYYEVAHPNIRNYTMIILGLYTALRISDVLNLKWKDVYYFEKDCFLDHLLIHEQKTGKVNEIALNSHVIKALDCYRKTRKPDAEDYIFSKPTTPCASALPLPGISYCTQSSGRNLMRNACQLSFAPQDVWLSCMETGNFSGSSDGSV